MAQEHSPRSRPQQGYRAFAFAVIFAWAWLLCAAPAHSDFPQFDNIRSFNPGLGLLTSIAFDPVSGNVFLYTSTVSGAVIHEFTPAGTEILPTIPRPGSLSGALDLDFASEPVNINGTVVPTNTLLVFNGQDVQQLFGLNKNNGTSLADLNLPGGAQLVGGAYHPGRNTIFVVNFDTDEILEVNPANGAQLNSFPVSPAGSPAFDVNFGDVDVNESTGNLFVVSSSQNRIRELTPTGGFVRDIEVGVLGISGMSGIAIDNATGEFWVSSNNGLVFQFGLEVECKEGFPFEPIDIMYGDHTVGCEINPALDMDTFEFEGDLGDLVRLIVAGTRTGFDTRLQLRDPDGLLLVNTTCDARFNPCRILEDVTLPKTGTYSIKIGEQDVNAVSNYTLQLERLFPFPPAPCLGRGITENDIIAPVTDVDYVRFGGVAGTEVQLTLGQTRRGFDNRLEVWDPDGLLLVNTTCDARFNPCSIAWPAPGEQLPKTGVYLVAISEQDSNARSTYQLNLTCVFGNCPPQCIPPSCPNGPVEAGINLSPSEMVTGDIIFEATQTIATGSNFTVTPSGCASLFAGGQVELKPGTKVDPGGVLQVVVE